MRSPQRRALSGLLPQPLLPADDATMPKRFAGLLCCFAGITRSMRQHAAAMPRQPAKVGLQGIAAANEHQSESSY